MFSEEMAPESRRGKDRMGNRSEKLKVGREKEVEKEVAFLRMNAGNREWSERKEMPHAVLPEICRKNEMRRILRDAVGYCRIC